jgi:hypothetical protein
MGCFCSVALSLKFFEMFFPFKLNKNNEFAAPASHFISITTQMRSVMSDDPLFPCSLFLPLYRCIIFTTCILQVLAILIQFLRQVRYSLTISLYRCAAILFILCVIYWPIVKGWDHFHCGIPQDLFIFTVRVRRIADHRTQNLAFALWY